MRWNRWKRALRGDDIQVYDLKYDFEFKESHKTIPMDSNKGIIEKASLTARFLVRKQQEYRQLQQDIVQLQHEVMAQNNIDREG